MFTQPIDFHSHAPKRLRDGLYRSRLAAGATDADGDETLFDNEDGSTSQTEARTRNPVITPQCLVIMAADVPKEETKFRKATAQGYAADLLAPHAGDENTHAIVKGQLVWHQLDAMAGFRTNLENNSNIKAVGAANGLTLQTKLGIPGVAQVNSNPANLNENQAQTGVVLHGVQTVVQFGSQRINAGDLVMLGRFPELIRDQDGTVKPAVKGPDGHTEEQTRWPIVKVYGRSFHGFMQNARDIGRIAMGTADFKKKVQGVKNAHDLRRLLHETCDDIFRKNLVVEPDHPVRGFLLFWMAHRYYEMVVLAEASAFGSKPEDRGAQMRMAILAELQVLREVETRFQAEGDEYACSLPHDGDHIDARNAALSRRLSSLADNGLTKQLEGADSLAMLQGVTRVHMHYEEALQQFYARIYAYFGARFLGTALTSGGRGDSIDIFVGKM